MKISTKILLFTALLLTVVSCKKEEPVPVTPYEDFIFIGNQGAWGANNGSLTAYNAETKEVVPNVFEAENGYKLGDLVQSMAVVEENLYICVAGSEKIEVVDRNTMTVVEGIQNIENPRYMLPVSLAKAYVSSWESGGNSEIAVVNLLNNTKTGSIQTGWIESMVLQGTNAWATGHDTNKVFLIDLETDVITNEIDVNFAPQSMIKDTEDHVWVLSWGEKDWMANTNNNTAGSIARIDPSDNSIEKQFFFPNEFELPSNLTIDGGLRTLYYVYEGNVYRMDIGASALPTSPIVDLPQPLYAVGARSNTEVYITESAFSSNGMVYVYDGNSLVDSLVAGIGPASFSF